MQAAGPPGASVARRVLVLAAVTLTVVVVLGYGAQAGWNALTGGPDTGSSAISSDDYLESVERSVFLGGAVIGAGIDVRLSSDINGFVDAANQAIAAVNTERGNLQALARSSRGARADLVTSTAQTLDRLEAAMGRWRDVVSALRLGQVADAKAEVEGAVAQLQTDAERWRALPG
ncbi:MAG: hypothetical protein ACKOA9_00815 [Actinomycetota bacterium]